MQIKYLHEGYSVTFAFQTAFSLIVLDNGTSLQEPMLFQLVRIQ